MKDAKSRKPSAPVPSSHNANIADISAVITHMRIELSGCEYSAELENAILQGFATAGIQPVTRGQWTIAAGPALDFNLVVSIASGVASGLIVEAVKTICSKMKAVVAEHRECGCPLANLTIETNRCDIVINVNNAAGYHAENVNYNEIIHKMQQLCANEEAAGRSICRIETPCDINADPLGSAVRNVGTGSYCIWLLTYRNYDLYPCLLYDAANEVFLPLTDSYAIESAILAEDQYYSRSPGNNLQSSK